MEFQKILQESFKRYKLSYKGTRPDYQIHDPNPYVLALDDNYNVDGNGKSILGINLNYYDGDVKKLVNDVNTHDNAKGFRGFDTLSRIRQALADDKDAQKQETVSKRKQRYKTFIEEFPYLGKFIRRYKFVGPKGPGIQSQQRAILK
jgi:hypothetical protein